jgi:hypothetical protein
VRRFVTGDADLDVAGQAADPDANQFTGVSAAPKQSAAATGAEGDAP